MHIQYTLEDCDYLGANRHRPKSVDATDVILPQHPTPRDGQVQPRGLRRLTGEIDPRPLHTDRGHLIALSFGGPEESSNLAPMYGGFNSPGGAWGKFETLLTSHLNTHGNAVDLTVAMTYAATADVIPSAFDITVSSRRGSPLPSALSSPIKLLHTAPADFHHKSDAEMLKVGIFLQQRKEAMEEMNWYAEWELLSAGQDKNIRAGCIAPLEVDFTNPKQKIAFYATRPYGILDFIALHNKTEFKKYGGPNVSGGYNNGDEFSAAQVEFVLKMCVVRSLGYIKSDLWQVTTMEQFENMMIGSTDASAQVDHIWPQQLGGSNCYSNARVVSAKCNQNLKASTAPAEVAKIYRQAGGIKEPQ